MIEITYCVDNPANPTTAYILSWKTLAGSCQGNCIDVGQTLAMWFFGDCNDIPMPAPHVYTIHVCDKTCQYFVQCPGPGDYPLVTNLGCQ